MELNWDWALDGWIVAAGILCAVSAALLGNFLVLRRMSMLGDAISHAVLPGIAVAFLVSGSRNSWPMFVGAVIVGILTAMFTEWIRGIGKVDEGAAMGVVFTTLFAIGLVLIVQAADRVDLDPSCVLYGAIEYTPLDDMVNVAGYDVPQTIVKLGTVAVINMIFVLMFFKELKISAFDPALSTTTGYNANLMHYLLMILVAVTAVACFETVGNILVVAMFVVPPAAAFMLTDRLRSMVILSVCLAIASAVSGHVGAIVVPKWFGYGSSSTAGMMTVAAGLLFLLAASFGPRHGVLVKFVRRRTLAWGILADDVVALLYRIDERGGVTQANANALRGILLADRFSLRVVLFWLRKRKEVKSRGGAYELSDRGRVRAQDLVRSHRLWEQYLVTNVGVDTDRIHNIAERMEHFTDPRLRERLGLETDGAEIDPHGRPIPAERADEE
jgi:manganese/zinc/iron transport system permease protein